MDVIYDTLNKLCNQRHEAKVENNSYFKLKRSQFRLINQSQSSYIQSLKMGNPHVRHHLPPHLLQQCSISIYCMSPVVIYIASWCLSLCCSKAASGDRKLLLRQTEVMTVAWLTAVEMEMAEKPSRGKILFQIGELQLNLMNKKNWFSVRFAAENDKWWVSNWRGEAITNRL